MATKVEHLINTQIQEEPKKHSADHPLAKLFFQKHYHLTIRFFGVVISNVLVFGGLGYFLDYTFNTKPLFLIIGLVISFPLSLIMAVKIARQLTEKFKNQNSNLKPRT